MNRCFFGFRPFLCGVALSFFLGIHVDQAVADDDPSIPVQITNPSGSNVIREDDLLNVGGIIFESDWPTGILNPKPTHIMIQIEVGGDKTPALYSPISIHPDSDNNDRIFPSTSIPGVPDGPATIIVTPVKEKPEGGYDDLSEPTRKNITIQTQRQTDPAPPPGLP